MAPIATAPAVAFANEIIRVQADLLARSYNRGIALSAQWTAIGGGQPAVDALRPRFHRVATFLARAYFHSFRLSKRWTALGSPIPNTADVIADGSPGDGRQTITGIAANSIVNRALEHRQWLDTGLFAGGGGGGGAHLNTVLVVSEQRESALDIARAGNLINRLDELQAEYEAAGDAVLNTILAVAVNTIGE